MKGLIWWVGMRMKQGPAHASRKYRQNFLRISPRSATIRMESETMTSKGLLKCITVAQQCLETALRDPSTPQQPFAEAFPPNGADMSDGAIFPQTHLSGESPFQTSAGAWLTARPQEKIVPCLFCGFRGNVIEPGGIIFLHHFMSFSCQKYQLSSSAPLKFSPMSA